MDNFILKGDVCFPEKSGVIKEMPSGYIVCEKGVCRGAFGKIPERYTSLPVHDHSGRLIIPGLADLHVHAPQYPFCGLGTDLELLDWLNNYAFPEEEKYSDISYAEKAYKIFIDALVKSPTTRACVFGTIHTEATVMLMEMLEQSGLVTYVGKVSMDRNSPEALTENDPREALESWLSAVSGRFRNTFPIMTPRFIPACSDKLLDDISKLREKYDLPLQSHLSENPSEARLVKELVPRSEFYGQAYDIHGLFGQKNGRQFPAVMAHCVYSGDRETALMAENGVIAAHCPSSNMNLRSGIAPVRALLESGVNVGLGSDAAAGSNISIIRAMTDAVQVSKLYCRLKDEEKKPLSFGEAFYLAVSGGGFFGERGFYDGCGLDAVILDDSSCPCAGNISVSQRFERFCAFSMETNGITAKYVNGRRIF